MFPPSKSTPAPTTPPAIMLPRVAELKPDFSVAIIGSNPSFSNLIDFNLLNLLIKQSDHLY